MKAGVLGGKPPRRRGSGKPLAGWSEGKSFPSALIFFLVILLFFACTKQSPAPQIPEIEGLSHVRTIPLEYATAFRADVYKDSSVMVESAVTEHCRSVETMLGNSNSAEFTLLTVMDSDHYLLVPPNCDVPQNLPPEVKLIRLPIQNAYLCASSAMSLFSALDSLDSIRFSSIQKKDWYIEEAARAMEAGKIRYAGKYNTPDFELLLSENCSLAIESTMIYHAPAILEKLESLGVTVFVEKSSYEEHPLGRLEWVKVYGLLTGKYAEAEAFFEAQSAKLKKITAETESQNSAQAKRVAFFYVTPNGMVVIRGSDDYIAKMISLAGAEYAFKSTRKSSAPSVTISMEQFYAECADADILIYNSSIDNTLASKQDLLEKSPLFAEFTAVQNGNLWTTGRYLYQATDRIADVILDIHAILGENEGKTSFLRRVE